MNATPIRHFERELNLGFRISGVVALMVVGFAGTAVLFTARHVRLFAIAQLMALFTVVIAFTLFVVCALPEAAIRTWFSRTIWRVLARLLTATATGLIVHRVMFTMFDGRETYRTFGRYMAHSSTHSPVWLFVPFVIPAVFFGAYAVVVQTTSAEL